MLGLAMLFWIGSKLDAPNWYWLCWWIGAVLSIGKFGWSMYKAGADR